MRLALQQRVNWTARWDLRLGPTLLTPRDAYRGYLGSIFTGVLKNGAQWTCTWISEILSAAAWLQVALLCSYRCETAMRAMHKGIHRAFVHSPHDIFFEPCAIARRIQRWLNEHAYWDGAKYVQGVLSRGGRVGFMHLADWPPASGWVAAFVFLCMGFSGWCWCWCWCSSLRSLPLPSEYVVQDVSGDWCSGFQCLEVITKRCTTADCVCVAPG